MLNVAPARVPT